MTVSDGKSIAEILDLLGERCIMQEHGLTNGTKQDEVDRALADLEEIMMAAKPERRDLSLPVTDEVFYKSDAYRMVNESLDEYEQNIRQAISNGGGDE